MDHATPHLQLTNTGVAGSYDEARLAELFGRQHYLCLPQLLSPALLQQVQSRMAIGPWAERTHGAIGHEVTLRDPIALNLLTFLMNRPDFLGLIGRISGRAPLQGFHGRIYRMLPNAGHFDSWHDDIVPQEDRLVGLSINLGEDPYDGGVFRMRKRATGEVLAEIPNLIPGDARIFDIRTELQHMVTTVTGTVPKTAFAGWFRGSGRVFMDVVRAGRQE